MSYLYRVEPQVSTYVPDEDFFREPSHIMELGPDEQGNLVTEGGEQVQRVLRFTAGGLDDGDDSVFRR